MPRLFLGCPVPPFEAASIAAWTRANLSGARTLPPENLHATLMFFGEVATEDVGPMAALTKTVDWNALPVRTGAFRRFGRTALGFDLDVPEEDRIRLTDQVRSNSPVFTGPLSRLRLRLPEAEQERFRRCDRSRQLWPFHLTVARSKKAAIDPVGSGLDLAFSLNRLVLYESHLAADGARYVPLAEAGESL